LLKVLSRITKPTTGRFEINGRVSSLLEVGTGFHPELTGRENIYLNGTILGMRRAEIKAKFDEIIDFSGVEEFIDTPVKHYSSGMKVRLAFSVAAHLEPEILIIDEVLAVGDAEFQKKCLGKMEDVTGEGRTVLFVSHNMGAVEKLCTKGIFLETGKIMEKGTANYTIQKYLTSFESFQNNIGQRTDRTGNGELVIENIMLKNENDQLIDQIHTGQNFSIDLYYLKKVNSNLDRVICSISIKTSMGVPVFLIHNRMTNEPFQKIGKSGVIRCAVKNLPLTASSYYLSYSLIYDGQYLDALENAQKLQVISGKFYNSSEIPPHSHSISLLNASWSNS
jgi:lipopolysaccharide transport system ATP-binding protein